MNSQNEQATPTTGDQSGMMSAVQEAQEAVKETTKQTIDAASHTAQELAQQTAQQATDVVTQAADQVTDAISGAKEQASTTFTKQRDSAIASLAALADALRETGDRLSQPTADGPEVPASIGPMVQDAANRLTQSADFLRDKDVTSLLKEARDLAQRQPMLFIGSMFAIGLAGARILKETTADGADGGAQSPQRARSSMTELGSMRELQDSPGTYGISGTPGESASASPTTLYGAQTETADWGRGGVQE
jgi:hypothetical protein